MGMWFLPFTSSSDPDISVKLQPSNCGPEQAINIAQSEGKEGWAFMKRTEINWNKIYSSWHTKLVVVLAGKKMCLAGVFFHSPVLHLASELISAAAHLARILFPWLCLTIKECVDASFSNIVPSQGPGEQ